MSLNKRAPLNVMRYLQLDMLKSILAVTIYRLNDLVEIE